MDGSIPNNNHRRTSGSDELREGSKAESRSDVTRRAVIATAAAAGVSSLAGCGVVPGLGGPSVSAINLVIDAESFEAALHITVDGDAESLADNINLEEDIQTEAEIGEIEVPDSNNAITIPLEGDVTEEEFGDGNRGSGITTKVYGHGPIAITSDNIPTPDDQSVTVTYNNLHTAFNEGDAQIDGDITWSPSFTFARGSGSEHLMQFAPYSEVPGKDVQSLSKSGIDTRYEVSRGETYRQLQEYESEEPSENIVNRDPDYTGPHSGFTYNTSRETFVYNPCESDSPELDICTDLSQSQSTPWEYYEDIDTAKQIPGTSMIASPGIIQLHGEAITRYQISQLVDAVIKAEQTKIEDVQKETKAFLKELGSVLRGATGATTTAARLKFFKNAFELGNTLRGTLDTYEDYFAGSLGLESLLNEWLSFNTVRTVADIELNELLTELRFSYSPAELEYSTSQYQNALTQQLLLSHPIQIIFEQGSEKELDTQNGYDTDPNIKKFEWVSDVVKEYNKSLNRSIAITKKLRQDIKAETEQDSGPRVYYEDVSATDAYIGDTITVTATVDTDGDEFPVTLFANGEEIASQTADSFLGGQTEIEFNVEFTEPGEYSLQITGPGSSADTAPTISVESPFYVSETSLTTDSVEATDPVPVSATAENRSESDREFVLTLDTGGPDGTVTVNGGTVAAGEQTQTVAYVSYDSPGEYTISYAGEAIGTITVSEYSFPTGQEYPMHGVTPKNTMVNTTATGFTAPDAADTAPVRWRYTDVGGEEYGVMRPAIIDGTVYIPTNDRLVAADPGTGEELWSTELGDVATMTPAYMDGALYVSDYNGSVFAVDPSNGEIIARNSMNEHLRSLTVTDGEVFAYNEHQDLTHTQETVVKFDADLNTEWTTEAIEGFFNGAPAVGDDVVVVGDGRTTGAYDRATGELAWESERTWSNSPPSIHNGEVFVAGWSGYISGPTVGVYDVETGEKLRGNNDDTSMYTTPHIADDVIFTGGEQGVHAYDMNSLTKRGVYEMTEDGGGELFSGGINDVGSVRQPFAVTDSQVIAADDQGLVRCFARDSRTIEWEYRSDTNVRAVVAARDQVFVAADEKFMTLG